MPSLNIPQAQFLAMPHKFRAFVAGFGSGKTWTGCAALARHAWEHPKITSGYFAPTFPHIRDIFYPTVEEVMHDWGLRCDIKTSDKEVHLYSGQVYRGTVICRSMDRPETIVGFKIGHALIDELDVMKEDKARIAWRKIIARMRYNVAGLKNGVDVTTTPEGFKFTYEQFKRQVAERPEMAGMYGLMHASTYDNEENLPADYIQSLIDTYPPELIDAYIQGQFVNLTSGTVYKSYNREAHRSHETIRDGEPLFIGQDFNVGKMASVVYVQRGEVWHAVDELKDVYDTPALIQTLRERYPGRTISIYPDASGNARKSVDASKSDIALLQQAGLTVRVNNRNPSVKDRINAMNAAFAHGKLLINDRKCKTYAECLEQQAYDGNGEPDKAGGKDHMNDAGGYPIAYEMPIVRPMLTPTIKMWGR